MARTGMIAMPMRDQRAGDRADRVDVKISGRAVKSSLGRVKDLVGAHETKMANIS
ncbi:hypothetical protein [Paracoccus rhizosphaerae]|uniref:Uncharacterized protein n=1 Tax=Paracoccus rhizosphaerae TaxID=1133347 RepID=A0ABV6CKU0_9RHOB|nr:hypothetical protein [Paracoccus rhizosphaerae]